RVRALTQRAQRPDHEGGVDEGVKRERTDRGTYPLRELRIRKRDHPRRRLSSGTSETQRFERFPDAIRVFCRPGGSEHDIRTCVTKRLGRSEEHTSELQSLAYLVCRLLLEKK